MREIIAAQVEAVRASQLVLVVDDDERVRWMLERQLTPLGFLLRFACDGDEGRRVFEEGAAVSVIVADERMPGMSGTELLEWVSKTSPETVRVMITANADADTMLKAINDGQIFRFIPKPWSQDVIRQTVTEALDLHLRGAEREILMRALATSNDRLSDEVAARTHELQAQAEWLARANEELESSFRASIDMVVTIMGFADPRIMEHCTRTRGRVRSFAPITGLAETWQQALDTAALCHFLGLLSAPVPALFENRELTTDDRVNWEYHPVLGEMVLSQVPALARTGRIVGNYLKSPDDPVFEDARDLRLACQILKICSTYERAFSVRAPRPDPVRELERLRDRGIDGIVLNLFLSHLVASEP